MRDSMSLHKLRGNLKQFIVKVGIACKIDLISTSLPAWESIFSFQPWIFYQILSRM